MLFDKTHPLKASWRGPVLAQGTAVASAGNPAAAATKSKGCFEGMLHPDAVAACEAVCAAEAACLYYWVVHSEAEEGHGKCCLKSSWEQDGGMRHERTDGGSFYAFKRAEYDAASGGQRETGTAAAPSRPAPHAAAAAADA
jgi:hypothetical protein